MEVLYALLPFLALGIIVAGVSRVTGIAMSLLIVPALLFWGANPLDVITFMFLFVLYNNFTIATQAVRLNFKELILFRGWRFIIPIILVVVVTMLSPAAGVGIFIGCFVFELCATVYNRLPANERPSISEMVTCASITFIATAIGVAINTVIPENLFFVVVGIVILLVTAFAWYASKHRSSFKGTWDTLWSASHLLLGVAGIEFTSYVPALCRTFHTRMDRIFPILTVLAGFVGIIALLFAKTNLPIPPFVAALGSAVGIRMFGVYEFSKNGTFSYLAMATAVFIVLCLFLVNPTPVGLPQFM